MNLRALHCPNCGAEVEIEDGLDIFYCKYCGYRIILEGQSDAAYYAKARVKHMQHKEKMQEKRNAQERYRMEFNEKSSNRAFLLGIGIILAGLLISFVMLGIGSSGASRQDKQLQKIVDEIMIDIENKDFANAYIKANSLYWNDDWTSEGTEKWDAIRNEVIHQIEYEEKKELGKSSHEPDEDETDKGLFGWFK